MARNGKESNARGGKYHRARLRRFLFTHGPHRLSGGRITKRHLSCAVQVREIDIVSPHWPREFDGLRIGHVSDFHVGDLLPVERAVEIVEHLSEQKPDLVACTGDVVDLHYEGMEPVFEALGRIEAPLGTMFVMGNHDELDDADAVERMAIESGLILFANDALEIAHNGAHLVVAGVEWAKTQNACSKNVDAACDESVHLLLSHNPKSFKRAAEIGIPLTLAGHTHGGQIAMKKRPNANLAVTHRHSAGLFERNGSHLFVTTGVGAWFPLRVNCPAEIAMLTMRSGSA